MNTSSAAGEPVIDTHGPGPLPDRPGCFVDGAGTPVVMLHASLGSKSQWTPLAQRLAGRYRVIALDLCGYGENVLSAASASSFTLDNEMRLVTDHLDDLVAAHVRVHVVGHSYGGLVALRFAQKSRGRVASLSLYEPVAFRLLDDDDPALANVKAVAQRVSSLVAIGRRRDAAKFFVDFWGGEGSYASLSLPAQANLVRCVDKVPLDFRAASRWPLAPGELRTIVAPTLLLVGRRSPEVVRRIHRRLVAALANCTTSSFDCGHMGPITDAESINACIEAFVDRCTEREMSRAPA